MGSTRAARRSTTTPSFPSLLPGELPRVSLFMTWRDGNYLADGSDTFVRKVLAEVGVHEPVHAWTFQRYRACYFAPDPEDTDWDALWHFAWKLDAELAAPPARFTPLPEGRLETDVCDDTWSSRRDPLNENVVALPRHRRLLRCRGATRCPHPCRRARPHSRVVRGRRVRAVPAASRRSRPARRRMVRGRLRRGPRGAAVPRGSRRRDVLRQQPGARVHWLNGPYAWASAFGVLPGLPSKTAQRISKCIAASARRSRA